MYKVGTYRDLRTHLACVCLLAVVAGCGPEELPPELPPRAILWQRVSAAGSGEQRVISGIVTAISDARLAFEVGGTVESVAVSLGDTVVEGQVLARLDPEHFELMVRDAEAMLAEALALREKARADYDRTVRLYEARVASRRELDRATALRGARDSGVDATRARLELARRNLRRSALKSPFKGVISVRNIDPAMKVASGQPVFELDNEESGLRVEVQMPETLIARVRQGAEVGVGVPSSSHPEVTGRRFPAIVSEVGTRAGAGNAFPVRADLLEAVPGLRPGMTAEVAFTLPRTRGGVAGLEGFLIPIAAALPEADDRFSVFVFDVDRSVVVRRGVTTGGVRDNDIAVLDGLEEGEIIATAGVSFLRDGQPVTLLDEQLIRNAP